MNLKFHQVFLATLVLAYAPIPSNAAEKPILAVFDMEDMGADLSPEMRARLSIYLAVLLAEGGYQVIPQTEIRERLRHQKSESYKSCYDKNCQIEIGKELAAQMSLAGRIIKMGEHCRVTATLYDLKKVAAAQAASVKSPCDDDALAKAIEDLARKLSKAELSPTAIAMASKWVAQPPPAEETPEFEFDETLCPPGTKRFGKQPPGGHQVYCAYEAEKGEIVRHGWEKGWFDNGALAYSGENAHGGRYGTWTFWYSNGQKRLDAAYEKGMKDGHWVLWSRDGKRLKEEKFVAGAEVKRATRPPVRKALPPPEVVTVASTSGLPVEEPPVIESEAWYEKWWVWAIVGSVAVGTAVGLGVALTDSSDDGMTVRLGHRQLP